MEIRCTVCNVSKRESGRIFCFCPNTRCNANYCSKCGSPGYRCPRCDYKYLTRG